VRFADGRKPVEEIFVPAARVHTVIGAFQVRLHRERER
jgi:hypothetical protein